MTQGDSEAADVIMSINDKVNTEALTPEQENLKQQQMDETEGLEDRQLSEKRDMNSNLDDEMATEELSVDTQIQQQKRLVCTCISSFHYSGKTDIQWIDFGRCQTVI